MSATTNLLGLIKCAASEENKALQRQALSQARGLLKEYNKSEGDEDIKAKLLDALQHAKNISPMSLEGGIYGVTKDQLNASKENFDRGNPVRGALGLILGTPLAAVSDTLTAPFHTLARLVTPKRNALFRDIEDLKDEDDPSTVSNAANELISLLKEKRIGVDDYFPTNKYVWRRFKTNPVAEFPSLLPAPYYLYGDLLNAPVTALMNGMKWNGKDRDQYEDELIQKAIQEEQK